MNLTVNLGPPFEAIIDSFIRKGYAGNQTEVIRQALIFYDRFVKEEEAMLVRKAVEAEMAEIKNRKAKTYTLEEVERELNRS